MNIPRWFILLVGTICLLLWTGSFIASIAIPTYKPDPYIGAAAMTVVTVCFSSQTIRTVADRWRRVKGDANEHDSADKGSV